jgi:predicted site-specific integrase-resolvase
MIGKKTEIRINVTYARVSLNKQKKDLINQSERIYSYAISSGIPIARQYEDIKSGMNFNDRKQFNLLINEIIDKKIGTIVVENKDRLCRFGFDLFENFCKQFKTQIVVASEVESKTYEQELTDDLISIVHYFSMKSYSNRRKLNKIRLELLK